MKTNNSSYLKTAIPTTFQNVGVVIAAGGSSQRFDSERNKLLCELDGLPVICHCLATFMNCVPAANIVITVPAVQIEVFREALVAHGMGDLRLVAGGAARQDSVLAGINALPETLEILAIHDAARPFTKVDLIHACINSARERGSGVAARRVTDTIKIAKADGQVVSTPDRDLLWAAETPQVFQRDLIASAYGRLAITCDRVTDDARAIELAGGTVFLVAHESFNHKITYATDLDQWRGMTYTA